MSSISEALHTLGTTVADFSQFSKFNRENQKLKEYFNPEDSNYPEVSDSEIKKTRNRPLFNEEGLFGQVMATLQGGDGLGTNKYKLGSLAEKCATYYSENDIGVYYDAPVPDGYTGIRVTLSKNPGSEEAAIDVANAYGLAYDFKPDLHRIILFVSDNAAEDFEIYKRYSHTHYRPESFTVNDVAEPILNKLIRLLNKYRSKYRSDSISDDQIYDQAKQTVSGWKIKNRLTSPYLDIIYRGIYEAKLRAQIMVSEYPDGSAILINSFFDYIDKFLEKTNSRNVNR